MAKLTKSAAYLQGLISGADFQPDEKTKLIWEGLLKYCGDVAETCETLEARLNDLEDYLQSMDEDLSQLEEDFYQFEITENNEEENTFYELNCPNCQENLCIEEMVLNGRNVEVLCPTCGETIYVFDKKGLDHAAPVSKENEGKQ
ncbi:MAG: CD1247 N-terminal domain-containing protein [Bacillota bacterium]